jgi:hypothetical protein
MLTLEQMKLVDTVTTQEQLTELLLDCKYYSQISDHEYFVIYRGGCPSTIVLEGFQVVTCPQ